MSIVVCDTRVRHQQTGGVAGGMAVEIARTTTTTVRVTVAPCSATGVVGTSVGMGEGAFGRDGGTVGGGVWVAVQCNTSNRPNTSFYITHRMELTQDKRFTIHSQSIHNPIHRIRCLLRRSPLSRVFQSRSSPTLAPTSVPGPYISLIANG